LHKRVTLEEPVRAADTAGGASVVWTDRGTLWAELRFMKGAEAVEAGGLQAQSTIKVRLRASALTRSVTADWRLRVVSTAGIYNLRQVSQVTDPANVWLVAETGVAV